MAKASKAVKALPRSVERLLVAGCKCAEACTILAGFPGFPPGEQFAKQLSSRAYEWRNSVRGAEACIRRLLRAAKPRKPKGGGK